MGGRDYIALGWASSRSWKAKPSSPRVAVSRSQRGEEAGAAGGGQSLLPVGADIGEEEVGEGDRLHPVVVLGEKLIPGLNANKIHSH